MSIKTHIHVAIPPSPRSFHHPVKTTSIDVVDDDEDDDVITDLNAERAEMRPSIKTEIQFSHTTETKLATPSRGNTPTELHISQHSMQRSSLPPGSPTIQQNDTHSPELTAERHARLGFTVMFALLLTISLICGKTIKNITIYHIISLMLLFALILWVTHLLSVIFSFEHLHYIRVRRKRVPNATNTHLFIPYDFEEKKDIPLSSVSLICALRGSNVESAGNKFFDITFGLIFCAVTMKWTEATNNNIIDDIELIMLLISAYGVFIVPLWSLEAYSKLSNLMHYVSTAFFIFLAPLSFCLYQNWSAVSVILLTVSYIVLFLWLLFMEYVQRIDYKSESELVHRNSLIVLIIELIGIICVYSTFIAFIYCMANDKIL